MIQRHIQTSIRRALADTPVVLLNGARQTGKTTLAQAVAHTPLRLSQLCGALIHRPVRRQTVVGEKTPDTAETGKGRRETGAAAGVLSRTARDPKRSGPE